MFEQPVQLSAATDYTVALTMSGSVIHERVVNAISSIAASSFTLTTKTATVNGPAPNLNYDNGTDRARGQIPQLYFSV